MDGDAAFNLSQLGVDGSVQGHGRFLDASDSDDDDDMPDLQKI